MKEYKHIFDALVEGKQVQFRVFHGYEWKDISAKQVLTFIRHHPPDDFRIKPRTIMIGDMEVPEPCREPLEMGQKYWLVAFEKDYIFDFGWEGDGSDFDWLKAARIHLTLEAAEQHRIALIKVSGGEP